MIQNLKKWWRINIACVIAEIAAIIYAIYKYLYRLDWSEKTVITFLLVCLAVFVIAQFSYFAILKEIERELFTINTKLIDHNRKLLEKRDEK